MITHPLQYCQKLTVKDVEKILEASLCILQTKGMIFQSPQACRLLAEAGAKVDFQRQHAIFSEDLVLDSIAKAPGRWTLYARNPDHNVSIGGKELVVSPGYGSAFIADGKGSRRESTMKDFEIWLLSDSVRLLILPGAAGRTQRYYHQISSAGNHLCPDSPVRQAVYGLCGRGLRRRGVAGYEPDCVWRSGPKPCVMALININSPCV